uniref:Retrotransposon gag domain-containing protein n=1 Tax=Cajanus cajan TaxID=3821 RepID=A0A151UFJ5_CAJCA
MTLPLGWKPLHLDRYDNTTDPDEHIDLYTTQVNLYTNNDAILCRVFPTSLKGVALNWYTQLSAESIDNFHTLVRQFTAQYATSRPHHVTSAALASLCQGDDESMRAFMERFTNISVKIRNLNPEVALHAMLIALKPGPFIDNLCREAPRDMDELHARGAGYIQIEEHSAFCDQVHGKSQAKPDSGHKDKMKVTNDS